jgi:hypothetical protein
MSKPGDATPKDLLERFPLDWPAFRGFAGTSVDVLDADISTVSGAVDKVLRLRSSLGDWLQHYEFQTGPDGTILIRMRRGSVLLEERHGLPVESILVLLSKKANLKKFTGVYETKLPGASEPYIRFNYRVERVYEWPVDQVLSAGLGVLPLAPISKVKKAELPGVIGTMKKRIDVEADKPTAAMLWTATEIYMGLRYEAGFVNHLLRGIDDMEESTTYQAILEKGRTTEARRFLLRMLEARFGSPAAPAIRAAIESVPEAEEVEELGVRLLQKNSWDEILPIQ